MNVQSCLRLSVFMKKGTICSGSERLVSNVVRLLYKVIVEKKQGHGMHLKAVTQ